MLSVTRCSGVDNSRRPLGYLDDVLCYIRSTFDCVSVVEMQSREIYNFIRIPPRFRLMPSVPPERSDDVTFTLENRKGIV